MLKNFQNLCSILIPSRNEIIVVYYYRLYTFIFAKDFNNFKFNYVNTHYCITVKCLKIFLNFISRQSKFLT